MRPADAASKRCGSARWRARTRRVRAQPRTSRARYCCSRRRGEPLRYYGRASDNMPADLLSDSLLYIVSYMQRLLVEQPALELVSCADCDQCPGPPRAVSSLAPRRPAAVWRGRPRRRSRSRRRICVADEVCVRTDSSCTRTSLRRGIGPRPEDRPLPRGVHAVRAVGSAQLVVGFVGESGAAAAAAVEAVDDAVLSGRARTTKQARHRRDSSGRGF